jgi:phosphatidate cytidylyltransferase
VGAALGLLAYKYILFYDLRVADVLVLGVLGGVMGPVGDLCESMLKRAHGVKDSGKIVPGHGGILDRIDALIFNAPVVFLYLTYGRQFFTGS